MNANRPDIYDHLLASVRALYASQPALADFAPLGEHLAKQQMEPLHHPSRDLFEQEPSLNSAGFSDLLTSIQMASPHMQWREIYTPPPEETNLEKYAFAQRLGCFSITGQHSPFECADMRLFMVYMPAGLDYPWHSHRAEELYFILSGQAVFQREGHEDELLKEGDMMFHQSNQPHAMHTSNAPMVSLAIWRNHLSDPVILLDID